VVVDLEDPTMAKFYNLQGKSYSNSFQAELNVVPLLRFNVRLAYRLFDVKTTYGDQLLEKPFTARNRGFANLAYEINGWKFDYTVNYNSRKRIPSTEMNPPAYQREPYSPSYVLMNAQVSKTLGKLSNFDIYLGAENIISQLFPEGRHYCCRRSLWTKLRCIDGLGTSHREDVLWWDKIYAEMRIKDLNSARKNCRNTADSHVFSVILFWKLTDDR
jgi:hypothetical protein